MKYLLLVSLLAFGCVSHTTMKLRYEEGASKKINCSRSQIKIKCYNNDCANFETSEFKATCGKRVYNCLNKATLDDLSNVQCSETAETRDVTLQKVVIDRVSLESGCSAEKIKIVQRSKWVQGQEQAFRTEACGKPYICTSALGRTKCKLAANDQRED
jgi:hypothetical protein